MAKLNTYQIWDICIFFSAIARLSGKSWLGMPKDLPHRAVEDFTDIFAYIHTEGGGNPILAAEKRLQKMTLSGRFGRAAHAYTDYWLQEEQYYEDEHAENDVPSDLYLSFQKYLHINTIKD